jgi:MFS family permease
MFCTVGFANAFGVFQEYYMESLNESASNVAWLGAISIFILYAGSLFTGPILDIFGPVVSQTCLVMVTVEF